MDNNIKAIETSIALTRRCISLINGNVTLKLQLEDKILKFEQLRNHILHARFAAPQPATVVPVVPPSSTVTPMQLPSNTVAATPSATVTATTGSAIASTSTYAAAIQAPQKYSQYTLV